MSGKGESQSGDHSNDWRLLAKMLDKIMLGVCIIMIIILTVTVIGALMFKY